jgi:hypothetical protein
MNWTGLLDLNSMMLGDTWLHCEEWLPSGTEAELTWSEFVPHFPPFSPLFDKVEITARMRYVLIMQENNTKNKFVCNDKLN